MNAGRLRASRAAERGTTVVIVVMITTLITAIGVLAVRNISQVDQAVGYSRQSAQTSALADLGLTGAMAEIALKQNTYTPQMNSAAKCVANMGVIGATCFPMNQAMIEGSTTNLGGTTLLQPAIAGSETGSFGALANTTGTFDTELTEKHKTTVYTAGDPLDKPTFDVTLTTFASVRPISTSTDPCPSGIPGMTVKKLSRAHVIVHE